ncbi:glutamate racemase [Candidatus Contubernalis alkaliaceticus]|uniref:glutamate racemase n=1 Tax=Candidatus Contubernalis alkaliaceticus TaxID=338645 RepID=UPI001F4BFDD6|nr:glutamate racemase [Candidatus Contubernalis alkalaceticus]UNC90885.1 glutamate racemase [Candidatus Contubernalis alkalaceticus]
MEALKSIALLDSGVGGLTVVKEILDQLPHERIVYFGDTARMPYGPRPQEEVRKFSMQIIDFLQTQDIKLVIVACNSASAAGLPYYQQNVKYPVIGVIEPGVRAALSYTAIKKVGVIGTDGTINSGAYEECIRRLDPQVEIYSMACPLFVLIVENNLITAKETKKVAEEYLKPLKEVGVDVLILGCTHYPLMAEVIQEVMGPKVRLISSAEETAREAKEILKGNNLLNPSDNSCHHRFFVSASPENFVGIGENLINIKVKAYQVILPGI